VPTGSVGYVLKLQDDCGQLSCNGVDKSPFPVILLVLGPLTGSYLGTRFGIPTVINGQPGFIPTPLLFQVAGVATLLAAIPIGFAKEKRA